MRLGKTRVAVAWINAHKAEKILVVAPLTVLSSWKEELHLLEEPVPQNLHTHPAPAQAKWFLINYEALRANHTLLNLDWDAVILDESTRIKNPKAQITRVLNGGTANIRGEKSNRFAGCTAPLRAILSGLPAPEGPLDYFEQFRFLFGGFCACRNYWSFRDNFFQCDAGGWDWYPKPGARDVIKKELHERAYILSRKEAGIGERKVYETRTVGMGATLRRTYRKAEKEFALEHPVLGVERETNWPMVMNIWLGRMAGGFIDEQQVDDNKLNELTSLLEGELKEEKVIVWCRFNAEIAAIEQRLRKLKILCASIIGATPLAERDDHRHALQDGNIQVLICQIKCARYGIDLSVADTAIYYSNSYSLEERAQSEDRIVHPLKQTPLLLVDLVTEDTVDEDVVKALRSKHRDAKFFLSELAENFRRRTLR
jgi:SNF2 family DNA or RNA helicase